MISAENNFRWCFLRSGVTKKKKKKKKKKTMVIEDQRQQESNKEMNRCTPMIVLVATIVILRFDFAFLLKFSSYI